MNPLQLSHTSHVPLVLVLAIGCRSSIRMRLMQGSYNSGSWSDGPGILPLENFGRWRLQLEAAAGLSHRYFGYTVDWAQVAREQAIVTEGAAVEDNCWRLEGSEAREIAGV